MNLLQSELIEHQKILDTFKQLPTDIKKYILLFHKSTPPLKRCPLCRFPALDIGWVITTQCMCFQSNFPKIQYSYVGKYLAPEYSAVVEHTRFGQ